MNVPVWREDSTNVCIGDRIGQRVGRDNSSGINLLPNNSSEWNKMNIAVWREDSTNVCIVYRIDQRVG